MRDKMAAINNQLHELDKSMQFLSDEFDDFKSFKSSLEKDVNRMLSKLKDLEEGIARIDEAIEAIHKYSYQYNLKILGIPQKGRKETSKQSVDKCLKLFQSIGAEVLSYDIDIAHRVPSRNAKFTLPIICKFTHRIAKESVMSCRSEANNIDLEDIGLTKSTGKIGIYEHLTPNTQDLFNKAKIFQKENKYAFCWTKNSNIFLKESEDSVVIRVTSPEVLENMVNDASISETAGISPGASMSFNQRGGPNTRSFRSRGRGGPRTRSSYNRDELSAVFGKLR
ncbi:uncharacterized protein LOC114575679 [Exaiptasia diaphana]|uniref:FP protein C-terminal domain-containing protein n=1 Tax=Exaiptasia diaphana TaxID=2652724 RepID=A0A913YP87_EXADI|nr:uncharacterized protein LOC114575679 [Exaiptasia diaphana]